MKHDGLLRILFVILILLSPSFVSVVRTEKPRNAATDNSARETWEYLVVSNPNRTNFNPTGNSRMRKEEMGSFGVEAFVLEQHLDRVGANGWELIAVSGTPNDPIFYFKRPRQARD